MGSPGRIWKEGMRGRLGHSIPWAPSLRDHFGLAFTLIKDHSSLESGPFHMSLSSQVLITVTSPCSFQPKCGNSSVDTIRALFYFFCGFLTTFINNSFINTLLLIIFECAINFLLEPCIIDFPNVLLDLADF